MADPHEIATWLYEGAVALQQGQRERARELLLKVVGTDEGNATGWLWLSGAVDDLDDMETALLNVLDLDPNCEPAQKGLTIVRQYQARRSS